MQQKLCIKDTNTAWNLSFFYHKFHTWSVGMPLLPPCTNSFSSMNNCTHIRNHHNNNNTCCTRNKVSNQKVFSTQVTGVGIFIRSRDYRKVVQPMIIWLLIFFTRPHKVTSECALSYAVLFFQEERFLFPIYPLFCLSAVVTLHLLPVRDSYCHSFPPTVTILTLTGLFQD